MEESDGRSVRQRRLKPEVELKATEDCRRRWRVKVWGFIYDDLRKIEAGDGATSPDRHVAPSGGKSENVASRPHHVFSHGFSNDDAVGDLWGCEGN